VNSVRIELEQHGRGRVFVDDIEISGVCALRFDTRARGLNELTITLTPNKVRIISAETQMRVTNPTGVWRRFMDWWCANI